MERDREMDEALAKLESVINRSGFKTPTDMAATIGTWHRTLQQGVTRLCLAWLQQLVMMGQDGDYDRRNEASVRFAQSVMENVPAQDRCLPLI